MNKMLFHGVILFFFLIVFPVYSTDESELTGPTSSTLRRRLLDKVGPIGRYQSVGVRGRLFCGLGVLPNATVKLWDKDFFDPDDLIAEGKTDEDGNFVIWGTAVSVMKIDPQLRIYHSCHNEFSLCKRKVVFTIPSNYINGGEKVQKWFELGNLNMEIIIKTKEEDHCIS
ncbi:unnamed protein product [Caenorhabditis auriculariae]|uniref:Uncharacterized protein n=1 Tax=Caenorhabditis auriculariae TaxID=2777116 RepID=A0A8S1HCC6_9PELO|nr:unnamed protein product [Caenorhabditis auriculariae]